MNKGSGYISLYRSIQSNFLWDDKPFARGQAWIDLLLKASYEDREIIFNGQYVKLEEGELITSTNKLADAWGWSRGKVRRFLEMLENASMVSYQTDNHKTVIKLLNFKEFQTCSKFKRTTNEQQTDNSQTANEQQTDTNNKDNKEKKDKKDNIYSSPCRHKYGEYNNVLLSDADLEKLKAEFPLDYEERIERLSCYIASTGKKYKNHLATIRNWAKKDKANPSQSKSTNATDDFMLQLQSMYE